ncbi:MAG: glycosyltransferase family 39 protein [Verrucomicrobiota bacterium]
MSEINNIHSRAKQWGFWCLFAVTVGISSLLLFTQLGHYALWDDEASSSLIGEGILATGDTSAILGHNIFAYDNGRVLNNLYDRFDPPLPSYIIAASFRLLGVSAFAARLPFALCGLATVAFIGYWLWKKQATLLRATLLAIGLTGNIAFFLYCRQARYYGAVILCSVLLGYFYCEWKGSRRHIALAALASIGLFGCNYLAYLAVYGVLAVDWLLWNRGALKYRFHDIVWLFTLQAVVCLPMALIWNPLATDRADCIWSNNLLQRLTLLWWHLRDLNQFEFLVGPLALAALVFYAWSRDTWWLRGAIAVLVYCIVIAIITPQYVGCTSSADVRYLLPLIPLGLFVGVLSLEKLMTPIPWMAIPLAVVAFHTNVLHLGPWLNEDVKLHSLVQTSDGGLHSSTASFVRELIHPPGDPYSITATWIRENVAEGQSIWTLPVQTAYPLMFHAPQAVYAWQLQMPPKGQFTQMPLIHFQGLMQPDYIIVFGPTVRQIRNLIQQWNDQHIAFYRQEAVLDFFWKDLYRPELLARTFEAIDTFNPNTEAIYIFKRIRAPANP